ncbi:MAG: beta-galactosidase, partial [Candidatus Zixiibacteriota bacterium]
DYNKEVLQTYYPRYLENLYENIKKLNARYKEKNADFVNVDPPRKFQDLTLDDYPKIIDWFRFREYMLKSYLEVIEDVFKSYTVEPLFFRSLYFRPGELLPAYNLVPEDRSPFLGSNVFPEGNYFDLVNKARFLKAEYGFAFATSFTCGKAATDAKREMEMSPIADNERRFFFASGLSAGYKGLNHYMFVDRDHWYGAPLHNDGTVSKGYDIIRKFNQQITSIGFDEMDYQPEIAVVGNRLYYWLRYTSSKKGFDYIERLMGESVVGVCRDFMRLKLHYGIRENREFESMKQYKLLFVPSTEIMAEKDQEALVELAKSGVHLVLCGLMPKYDDSFKECQVLANHFRVKTMADYNIETVSHKMGSFPAYVYGSIRSTDDGKVKKLAQCGSKTVGICSTRFKGNFHLFTFDMASGGNHHKLAFIESILENLGISSYLYSSDPSVDISLHLGEKKSLLFIVVPPPGELSDGLESSEKEIIVRVDLKKAGFSSPRIKLTNIFSSEEEPEVLKLTAQQLHDGIAMKVKYPDGLIYLVEKK